MVIERKCYVITYRFRNVIRRIRKVKDLDIYYFSRKSRYVVAYVDKENSEKVVRDLNKIKGVLKVEETLLDQPQVDIKL